MTTKIDRRTFTEEFKNQTVYNKKHYRSRIKRILGVQNCYNRKICIWRCASRKSAIWRMNKTMMKNEKTRFSLRAIALLTALFLVIIALPINGAMAAGTSITITNSNASYNEGAVENWQQVGSFAIENTHLPISTAKLIVVAQDVDAPGETDRIRIKNAGGDTVLLGRLTGMDGQINTTVLDVPAAFLTVGNYTLEMDMGTTTDGVLSYQGGWYVTICSMTLALDGGVGAVGAAVSFTASGTNVDTTLSLSSLQDGQNYSLEYKFTNMTEEKQIASATETYTASGTSGQVLQSLTLAADDAIVDDNEYQLDVIISDGQTIGTARATLGTKEEVVYTYYAITIKANEGGYTDPLSSFAFLAGESSQKITFSPNDGFTVKDVKIDGVSMGALSSYTFENVTANHTVEVEFMPLIAVPQTGSPSMIGPAILAILCSAGCFILARKKS